jgi:hypothetical protein
MSEISNASNISNVLTDWRRLVMAHLDQNLQGGTFEVVGGERDGPSKDRKLCHVFAPAVRADGGNINFARPLLLVRAWIPKQIPGDTSPHDPAPIEQLMIDLMETLQPIQVLEDINLTFNVPEVVPDYEDWGVQATLSGWMRNPATVA